MIDFDSLEKEMVEINKKKKAWDNAYDRAVEIWNIVSKNQDEYYAWKSKKKSVANDSTK